MYKHQKNSINAIVVPSIVPSLMETFYTPNLSVTIQTKFSSDEDEKNCIKAILQYVVSNTMMIFTDG